MKCPKCQFENPEDSSFCRKCGSSMELDITCPNCDLKHPHDSNFCNKCGHSLKEHKEPPNYSEPQSYTPKFLADKILTSRSSIEGERKLVTVFFADVANYTTLSEKLDPEEVHQIMDGCFKILMDEIHRHEGTINQFTGDGVMALFGAPIAHEDHAQRACHAALAVQKAIRAYGEKVKKDCGMNFVMRIGLNSGPVIVGSIGDDLRMDYTAVGDTTNLASRMESQAKSGMILISKNTNKLVRDYFELKSFGKIDVKGKEEPQEAYELIKPGEIETRIDASTAKGLTRFVGRKNSLPSLMEPLERVKAGSGQVVGIVGEAGVGKSRLLLEFINKLPKGEFVFLEGCCIHYGSAMAYLPILDILKAYFEIEEEDREFIIRKKIEEKIFNLDETLKNALPPLQDLFSLKVEDEKYLQIEPVEKKMRVFESLRNLFVRKSQNKPLIIAIDDLHWIDKISEEFIDYLIGWLQNAKIMLILMYRPEFTHQWGSKSYYTKVGLTQLGLESSSQLVQAILEDGEVIPELRKLILGRAGGNPLFVEELTQNLMENGSIEKKNQQYMLTRQASEIQVPDTIQGIIAARIDRIEESLKRVMQVASVIGREFAFRILESIIGMKKALKKYLLNLQGLEFISEKQLFPELEYIFKHALTQEVAYNSLLQQKRKEIHEKVGNAIEALYPERIEEYYELLAYHFIRSDNTEKALDYLGLANQKASRLNAMQEAFTYFNEAMVLLDTLDETTENQVRRISLLSNQAVVFFLLLKVPEYYKLVVQYEPMAVSLGQVELLAKFYSVLTGCAFSFGNFDQCIETGTKAIEYAKASGHLENALESYATILWSYNYKADYHKIHTLKKEFLSYLEKNFDLRGNVYCYYAIAWAYMQMGQCHKSLETATKAFNMAKKFSQNNPICISCSMIAAAYTIKGDIDHALKYAEMSLSYATIPGDEIRARSFHAWILCHAGEAHRGVEILATNLQICKAIRFQPGVIYNSHWLGEGYWMAGEYDKAIQTLNNLLDQAKQYKTPLYFGIAHYFLGEIFLEDDPEEASSHFEKSINTFQELKAEYYLARAYSGYGRYHKQQGDLMQARQYLVKALEIFERLEILNEPDKVKEELASLPPDKE